MARSLWMVVIPKPSTSSYLPNSPSMDTESLIRMIHPLLPLLNGTLPRPPHEDVELYIAGRIRDRLSQERYRDVRIVFVFSICTYSSLVMPPEYERGTQNFDDKGTNVGAWTFAAANRITVVTSTGQTRQVLKHIADNADGWRRFPSRMFSQKYTWGISTQTMGKPMSIPNVVNVPLRALEIAPMELPELWQDNNGERIRLTFGTCADAHWDKVHGKSNLTIFVGGGFSIIDVRDINRPFLMNDSTFWNPSLPAEEAGKRQPGYYWSKPLQTMEKAVYTNILIGPLYVLEAVKLTRADLVKVTDLFTAAQLVGKDSSGDLYLVTRGSTMVRNAADHTRSYGWTKEYIDFRRQKAPLMGYFV